MRVRGLRLVRGNSGRDGNGHATGRRSVREFPGIGLTHEFGGKRRVQGVTTAMHHKVTLNGMSDKGEVANDVQNLVANELVLEPQGIQHAGFAKDDGILERAAEREPALPQHFYFLEKTKR